MKHIALAGNPNSGKSTLFNALTGSTAFVGNWPGVTVEKREGRMKLDGESISVMDLPGIYSLSPYSSEEIISRDYILQEHPDVVINIVDASNLERNLYLTTQLIELNVPVVVALNMMDVVKSKGEVLSAKELAKELGCPVCEISAINKTGFAELKQAVKQLLEKPKCPQSRFHYEQDVEDAVQELRAKMQDAQKAARFYGVKLLSNDQEITAAFPSDVLEKASLLRTALEEKYDDEIDSIITEQRYSWIKSIMSSVIVKKRKEKLSLSDKIDAVVTNKWLALPIFFLIIYGVYWVCLNPEGPNKKMVGITFDLVFRFIGWVNGVLTGLNVSEWLVSLVCDGVLFGAGIMLAFIPYLMMLFVFLAILEECGYMARVTFIMDRVFRRFGLSGKSFIPMLLGTGCTVQAIAATRTIEDENDRKMTIFLTPFIPCATMMPTILLVIGLVTDSAFVPPLVYLFSIMFVIIGGIFLKHTMFKGEPAPFVMELPEYKLPRLKNIWHFVWEKTVALFRKAGSIIVLTTVVIWFLKYFSFSFQHVPLEESMLADIGRFLSPIFVPLGFSSWQLIAAMITGYVAKDNLLATLGVLYGEGAVTGAIASILSPASAVSFLLFFILSCPCFATMGAIRKELNSAKLTWQAIAFQMGTAYLAAMIAYQVLRFFI